MFIPSQGTLPQAFLGYASVNPALSPVLKGRLNKENNVIDINVGSVESKKFVQVSYF